MKKASATTVRAVQQLLPHLKATVSRVQQRQPFFALGLDVSSSFTGYTVLTPTGGLVRCGAIDLRKHGSTLEAAAHVESRLADLKSEVDGEADQHFRTPVPPLDANHGPSSGAIPWHVAIEDFLKAFGRGTFHTQGLFKLAQLNGIVAYQCNNIFLGGAAGTAAPQNVSREPHLVMPNAIRAFHGLKVPRAKKSKGSQLTEEEAGAAEGSGPPKNIKRLVWEQAARELPEDLWTYGARGGFQASNYDMADSYFVAKFMVKMQLEEAMLADEGLLEEVNRFGKVAKPAAVVDRFLFEGHHLENLTTGDTVADRKQVGDSG